MLELQYKNSADKTNTGYDHPEISLISSPLPMVYSNQLIGIPGETPKWTWWLSHCLLSRTPQADEIKPLRRNEHHIGSPPYKLCRVGQTNQMPGSTA